MSRPFFTIITATYNAAATLPRLLDSLSSQTCRDFEWVVQDGVSTDETLTIIMDWRDRLPAVSVESTPDTGIYDAWNKALSRREKSLGQWVLFLGADDLLAGPMVLEKVHTTLAGIPHSVCLACGDLEKFAENDTSNEPIFVDIATAFSRRYLLGIPIPHSALFCAGHLLKQNRFTTIFRIAGDYDWLLRVWQKENQALALGFFITRMSLAGVSGRPDGQAQVRKECRTIFRKHFPLAATNFHLYFFLLFESLLHEYILRIKSFAFRFLIGKKLWNILKNKKRKALQKL